MDGDEAAAAEQLSSRAVNEPSGSLAVIGNRPLSQSRKKCEIGTLVSQYNIIR